jgi:hypothetical protein
MKGFIDCQIEQGEACLPVVERTMSHIDHQIEIAGDRGRRELLRDLHAYIGEQMLLLTVAHDSPGSD